MEINTLIWIGNTLYYVSIFFFIFFVSKQIFKKHFSKVNVENELSVKDNIAFALLTVGFYIAILIIFIGIVQGKSYGYLEDFIVITGFSLVGICLLVFSSIINDKLMFHKKLNFQKELFIDENNGAGIVEAANYIGTALIIYGAITGEATNLFPSLATWGLHLSGLISLLVLWMIGQLLLAAFLLIYAKVSNYDLINQLHNDNAAVGIIYGSFIVAISYLYSNAIEGDIVSWKDTLENAVYYLVLGLILLPLSRWLIEKVVLPNSNMKHEIIHQEIPNQGIALLEAFAYIGSAILIRYCI